MNKFLSKRIFELLIVNLSVFSMCLGSDFVNFRVNMNKSAKHKSFNYTAPVYMPMMNDKVKVEKVHRSFNAPIHNLVKNRSVTPFELSLTLPSGLLVGYSTIITAGIFSDACKNTPLKNYPIIQSVICGTAFSVFVTTIGRKVANDTWNILHRQRNKVN